MKRREFFKKSSYAGVAAYAYLKFGSNSNLFASFNNSSAVVEYAFPRGPTPNFVPP